MRLHSRAVPSPGGRGRSVPPPPPGRGQVSVVFPHVHVPPSAGRGRRPPVPPRGRGVLPAVPLAGSSESGVPPAFSVLLSEDPWRPAILLRGPSKQTLMRRREVDRSLLTDVDEMEEGPYEPVLGGESSAPSARRISVEELKRDLKHQARTHARVLNFSGQGITNELLDIIIGHLGNFPQLQELDLSQNSITSAGVVRLVRQLKLSRLVNLQTLNLRQNFFLKDKLRKIISFSTLSFTVVL